MNMALVMTAVKHGATVANYTEVTELHKDPEGKLNGAQVTDKLTGESFHIRAKVPSSRSRYSATKNEDRVSSTLLDLSPMRS